MAKQGNATAYAALGAGVVLVWAGWANRSVLATLQDLVSGKKPLQGPSFIPAEKIPGQGSPDPNIDNPQDTAGIKGLAMAKLHGKGWDSQWPAFDNLVTHESNWSPTVKNPSSGAFGLAQALGHGTPSTNGTMANEYGGFGLSDTAARAANSGQSGPQLDWMINYIASKYGNPNNAWMKWLSRSPHWY